MLFLDLFNLGSPIILSIFPYRHMRQRQAGTRQFSNWLGIIPIQVIICSLWKERCPHFWWYQKISDYVVFGCLSSSSLLITGFGYFSAVRPSRSKAVVLFCGLIMWVFRCFFFFHDWIIWSSVFSTDLPPTVKQFIVYDKNWYQNLLFDFRTYCLVLIFTAWSVY